MRLRVRFAETDQMGIAHHAAYVVWLEAGRVEWLRERGHSYRAMEGDGVSLAVSGLHVAYRAALRFDDEVDVHTRLVALRSRRLVFRYRLTRADDGVVAATAETVHTPTDPAGRAIRLPERWMASLAVDPDDIHG